MIVRAGTTMTVLDLVGSVSRVLRRRVPVVITESPESRVQPLVLRFRERSGIQATIPTTSFEAAIRSMAEAPAGLSGAGECAFHATPPRACALPAACGGSAPGLCELAGNARSPGSCGSRPGRSVRVLAFSGRRGMTDRAVGAALRPFGSVEAAPRLVTATEDHERPEWPSGRRNGRRAPLTGLRVIVLRAPERGSRGLAHFVSLVSQVP